MMQPIHQARESFLLEGDCLELLPGLHVDLILTSPPYFNHITYGIEPPYSTSAEYRDWLTSFFQLAKRSAKQILIVHQKHFEDLVGEKAKQTILLKKFLQEYVYVYGDTLYPDKEIQTKPTRDPRHPCPFNAQMVSYLLEPFSRDTSILDPFSGIGTTVRVARQMGFINVRCIEKNPIFSAQSSI